MNILFWGITLGVFGKVLVVLAVLHMHHSLIREHKIDKKVILSYKQERVLTFIGLVLIVSGYLLEVWFYSPTSMFLCEPSSCEAAIIKALQ